jgi:hypothetical protein
MKTGLALGKLFPTLTVSLLPFTVILATPPLASVRADVCCTDVVPVVGAGDDVVEEPVPVGDELDESVCVSICWTNGSFPANVSKEYSCDFDRFGAASEFGSFVLPVASAAVATGVPEAVAAGMLTAPGVVEPAVALVVVAAAAAEFLLPPR